MPEIIQPEIKQIAQAPIEDNIGSQSISPEMNNKGIDNRIARYIKLVGETLTRLDYLSLIY